MTTPPFAHRLYGLTLHSALALDGVAPADPAAPVDVRIERVAQAPERPPEAPVLGPLLSVGPRVMWLRIPSVGTYLVEDGARIRIAPAEGADDDSLRLFLLGSAMGALLYQRGHILLHGNAIEVDGRCMVCVGPSGAGKSTLAAAMAARGHRVLADDVVPLTADGRILPGFPRIKLWRDAADHLGQPVEGLARVRPGLEKFSLPLPAFDDRPLPLRYLYVLTPDPASRAPMLKPLHGLRRFAPLRVNAYRPAYVDAMGLGPEQLRRFSALGAEVHMALARRPVAAGGVDALAEALLADMHAHA